MSIDEWWNRFRLRLRLRPDRSLSLFKIDRIHYSMFDVGRSMFDVHQFLICFDWTLAAGDDAYMKLNELNSEPQNIEQEISNDEVWNRFALAISD